MGGIDTKPWTGGEKSCTLTSAFKPCAWWCDKQSCDQCHPNNDGYTQVRPLSN